MHGTAPLSCITYSALYCILSAARRGDVSPLCNAPLLALASQRLHWPLGRGVLVVLPAVDNQKRATPEILERGFCGP